MKKMFHSGKFNDGTTIENIEGISSIDFCTPLIVEMGDFFTESLTNNVIFFAKHYDILHYGKENNKDIFCLYNPLKIKEDLMKNIIHCLLTDDVNIVLTDIINNEEFFLRESLYDTNISANSDYKIIPDDSIFWDVFNHYIIVLGKDNLMRLACAITKESCNKYKVDCDSINPMYKICSKQVLREYNTCNNKK